MCVAANQPKFASFWWEGVYPSSSVLLSCNVSYVVSSHRSIITVVTAVACHAPHIKAHRPRFAATTRPKVNTARTLTDPGLKIFCRSTDIAIPPYCAASSALSVALQMLQLYYGATFIATLSLFFSESERFLFYCSMLLNLSRLS